MRVLLIDNYDSFIYNLKYELELAGNDVTVCRNDIPYQELARLTNKNEAVVLSPGPGSPSEAGHCIELVKEFAKEKPILGVCLGHQVIIEAFGGTVGRAKSIVHGKANTLSTRETGLMQGLGSKIIVARYHSLSATEVSKELRIDAVTADEEVMAVSHIEYPVFGLQFHPESIMTKNGTKILKNFIDLASGKSSALKDNSKKGAYHAEFA
jgi:anthranilate synthase/aminodeoxychorismate synthase-like glutamine amidotransferase